VTRGGGCIRAEVGGGSGKRQLVKGKILPGTGKKSKELSQLRDLPDKKKNIDGIDVSARWETKWLRTRGLQGRRGGTYQGPGVSPTERFIPNGNASYREVKGHQNNTKKNETGGAGKGPGRY